jgi:hypothetical protein
MSDKISDYRVSIKQLFTAALVVGVPYLAIGVIWALSHGDHIPDLRGLDRIFSALGEIVAWPVLTVSDVTLK